MAITLTDRERRLIALAEDVTGAGIRDCIVGSDGDRVVFVVAEGEMATAIGPDGRTVRQLEDRLDRSVKLVEHAERVEDFVANALAPAAVEHVTVSENDDCVAYAEVPSADRGAAIGAGGRNIQVARRLAARHFDLDDIQLS